MAGEKVIKQIFKGGKIKSGLSMKKPPTQLHLHVSPKGVPRWRQADFLGDWK